MIAKACSRLLVAALLVVALAAPAFAEVRDLVVSHNPDGSDDNQFATIQAAINRARSLMNGNRDITAVRILVRASDVPYGGPIAPVDDVQIIGESVGNTLVELLSANSVDIDGVARVAIRNLTFTTAATAIAVNNSSAVQINNNVFRVGSTGTALRVTGSPDTTIRNNTFYNNGTAVDTASDITITNNIFANNNRAITTQTTLNKVSYNDFFQNNANPASGFAIGVHAIPSPTQADANPRFVDAPDDFRLQAGSAAKGSGNPLYQNFFDTSFDMGAFGGPDNTVVLFPVTGVTAVATSSAVTVSWNRSDNAQVTGYRVYYGSASRDYHGTEASEGASPVTVLGAATTSATLNGLPAAPPAAPAAPNVTATPLNNALLLSWNAVPGASRYLLYHSATSFDAASLPAPVELAGNVTSFTITGLSNDVPHFFAVRAVAENRVFVAVTAVINTAVDSTPGSANESALSAEPAPVALGGAAEGALSAVGSESPSPIAAYPGVKGEGCFIATAAFGFYSAPQVQLLRDFRDRYLMTCAPGRAFVAWYYHYGPYGARFINEHPWLKPPVRAALFPLIATALFLLKVPAPAQLVLAGLVAVAAIGMRIRKSRSRRLETGLQGGAR